MDVEPYGSRDLGGDPSDDEPPSMDSSSPSDDEDPEDPEDPKGKKKKKKKKKTRRPEGRRAQEAKAIATSKIVVNLPEFTGKDLSEFAENFGRFLRLTGQTHASGRVKCDLLLQCCKTKYLEKQVRQIVTNSATFADVLVALEGQYPTYETDLSIRAEIQNLPVLPNNPKPGRVSELLADLDHWAGRLTPGSRHPKHPRQQHRPVPTPTASPRRRHQHHLHPLHRPRCPSPTHCTFGAHIPDTHTNQPRPHCPPPHQPTPRTHPHARPRPATPPGH